MSTVGEHAQAHVCFSSIQFLLVMCPLAVMTMTASVCGDCSLALPECHPCTLSVVASGCFQWFSSEIPKTQEQQSNVLLMEIIFLTNAEEDSHI